MATDEMVTLTVPAHAARSAAEELGGSVREHPDDPMAPVLRTVADALHKAGWDAAHGPTDEYAYMVCVGGACMAEDDVNMPLGRAVARAHELVNAYDDTTEPVQIIVGRGGDQ